MLTPRWTSSSSQSIASRKSFTGCTLLAALHVRAFAQQAVQHLRRALDLRVIAALQEIGVDVAVAHDAVLHAVDREHVALDLLVEPRFDREVRVARAAPPAARALSLALLLRRTGRARATA